MLRRVVFLLTVFFSFAARAADAPAYTPSNLYQRMGEISVEELGNALRQGADLSERDHRFGVSMLGRAASFNKEADVIELMLQNGADINVADRSGKTPLMAAASFNNNPAVIKTLLKYGADPNAVDNNGINALMYAAAGQCSNIVSYVKRHISDVYTMLPIASNQDKEDKKENCVEIVRTLMGVTRHVDAVDKAGKNVLSHAAASNNLTDIIYLLSRINPNFEDKSGNTPLFEAVAANQDMEIVKALLDIGADINYRNRDGMTALSVAAIGTRYPVMVDLLLSKGARTDIMDNFGKYPMFYAQNNPNINNSPVIKKLSAKPAK